MFKKLVLAFIVLIAIVVGALVIFAATFDANNYKNEITALIKKQTGRELNIGGDLKLAIYPDVALEMGKTSLSNAAGFAGESFATIDSGRVSVKLLPLLKKKIEADAVLLDGLKLDLHRKADGSSNWDDLAQGATKTDEQVAKKEEKAPSKVVEEMMQNLSIAGVSLKNANIRLRDDQAKQDITVSPLNLSTGKFVPGKSLPVELDVVVKQKKPAMTIAAEGTTTVTLTNNNKNVDLSNLIFKTNVSGAQIPNGALDANISGDIKANPQNINVTGLTLESTLTGDLIPDGAVKTNLTGNVAFDINAQQLTVKGMKLENNVKGKPLAGGTLQAFVSGNMQFNISNQILSIPNLLLDAKLTGGHFKGGKADANIKGNMQFDLSKQLLFINAIKASANASGDLFKGGKANSDFEGDLQLDLAQSQIRSPQISLNSHVEGGLIPGGKLTQTGKGTINLNWANNKGSIDLASLLVNVAGLNVTGNSVKLQPLAAKPAVSGQFQTNSFNLRTLLKTLGIEPPVTSNPNALSQAQAQFSLNANTDMADLKGLTLKLDKSQLNGAFAISNFSSPTIRTQLSINSINLDDYLAPTSKLGNNASADASNTSGNQEILPQDTLRQLNINGDFKIGNMIVNKLKMSNITAKVNAKQGLIIIDPANAQLYKGKYVGRITLDAKQATPTMKMRHQLTGVRSEGLLFDLFQDKYISGGAKMTTELSSRGNTLDALLKNLNGTTSIGFDEGTIRDSNLAEKVSLAVKAFEKKEIKDGKSVVKFTGLSGDFKTNNGVISTNNLSMLSPYFNINGSGTADVANQKLDMKLRIGPNKQDANRPLFAPLRITGTFTDPKFSLDLEDLVKTLAAQDLKKLEDEAKAKIEQQVDKAKNDLVQKLKEKTGDQLGDAIINSLGGKKSEAVTSEQIQEGETTPVEEEPKSVEDQLKDTLKEGLRGLF